MTPADTTPAVVGEMDHAAFSALVQRHRRELQVHCYRMTGSYTDAEDLVQETFLRAWRGRARFEGRATVRAWLYRIATNACLDALGHSSRRALPVENLGDPLAEGRRLQPFPDARLPSGGTGGGLGGGPLTAGPLAGSPPRPDVAVVTRETIELGFVAALLHLPPRQRAVVIIRDVLGWTADETAAALDITVVAANSLLQRARAELRRHAPADRSDWTQPATTAEETAVLQRYVRAHERGDAEAIVAMLRADIAVTMPPEPPCVGSNAAVAFFCELLGPGGPGDWRLVPTRANTHPATANYLRRPGDDVFRALSIDVLRVVDGQLVEVNCFLGDRLFPAFGLPGALSLT